MARPTIERPTKGAKTSGKSVRTSIVNIGITMFAFLRRFAWRVPGENHRQDAFQTRRLQAFRAIESGKFDWAEKLLSQLLAEHPESLNKYERATLHNKRGVARIGSGAREAAREDFHAAVAAV